MKRTDYVNDNGKITIAADVGYATKVVTKTDTGEIEIYYDEKGQRISRYSGYYGIFREYDEAGNNIRNTYLDASDNPMLVSGGYAIEERFFNTEKQNIEVRYLDTDGNPVLTSLYGAGKLNEFDENGKVCRITYVDEFGDPVMTDQGYAYITQNYYFTDGPENGKVESEFYFDEKTEPISLSLGQYGEHKTYDENGQPSSITYLDAQGDPIITNKGYTTVVRTYHANNSVATELYYDINGDPIPLSEGQYGIQKEDGQTTYLDKEGNQKFNVKNLLYNQSWLVILCALIVVLTSTLLSKNGNYFLLVIYIGAITYFTLMFREAGDSRINLELFWSYKEFFTNSESRADIFRNIWLFVPLGAILYRLCAKKFILFIPVIGSIMIEVTQYYSGIGLCELDDVINNSLGSAVGYEIASILWKLKFREIINWRKRIKLKD